MRYLLIFYFAFHGLLLTGQSDFRAGFEEDNPAPLSSGLSTEERLAVHQDYLQKVTNSNDTLKQIYGEIYLFYDYSRLQDYVSAASRLLTAEDLANKSGNKGWQGAVAYRRGHLRNYLREFEPALNEFKQAVKLCSEAGDSLCIAESMEQVSAMYGVLDSFELAHSYFEKALPLLKKFGGKNTLSTAVANYGLLLSQQGKPEEAIPYFEEAILLHEETGNLLGKGKALNNLAFAHLKAGRIQQAIKDFNEAIVFNQAHDFPQNIVRNYAGLRNCYDVAGDYLKAMDYQELFYNLQDSLIGANTKIAIADLESKYAASQEALKLKEVQNDLLVAEQDAKIRGFLLVVFLISSLLAILFWRQESVRHRAKINENQKNLSVIARLLAEKNEAKLKLLNASKLLTEKTEQPADDTPPIEEGLNLFDYQILTSEDWAEFKAYFEQSYPGYLQRLRSKYDALTEAEERLFLLLKMNLTSREITNVLGISDSGVKKTRNRLRKKIALGPQESLEDRVRNF